jgi:hypothetical protein
MHSSPQTTCLDRRDPMRAEADRSAHAAPPHPAVPPAGPIVLPQDPAAYICEDLLPNTDGRVVTSPSELECMGVWRRALVAINDESALVLASHVDTMGSQGDFFEPLSGEWAAKSSAKLVVFRPSSDSGSDTRSTTAVGSDSEPGRVSSPDANDVLNWVCATTPSSVQSRVKATVTPSSMADISDPA